MLEIEHQDFLKHPVYNFSAIKPLVEPLSIFEVPLHLQNLDAMI